MSDIKDQLHAKLRTGTAAVLSTLVGLDEHDVRRPMTPSGTNLLGLVKHLASNEHLYLNACVGRPLDERLPWVEDGSVWDGADMWALPTERRDDLVALYERVAAHSDRNLRDLPLDAPASVPHWPEDRRETTLGVLLVRMVSETAQHAGHAEVVRELIDGRGGPDRDDIGDDAHWQAYVARIQAAADLFLPE